MTEQDRNRLFQAWAEAASRSVPALDPRVRSRVLSALAEPASKHRTVPVWAYATAAAALAILAVLVGLRAPAVPSFRVEGQAGRVGTWLSAPPLQTSTLRFSEGTQISLTQGSRARVMRVTRGGAQIELARGEARAEVHHLPGAEWTFDAGPFEVAVTGTALDVSWAPETGQFELSVSRGSVLVSGPFIQGKQDVRAGQVCRVDLNRHVMELARSTAEPAHGAAELVHSADAVTTALPTAAGRELPPTSSPTAAPSSGPTTHASSAEELLEEARAARLAGRPDLERAALLACRKRAPGQPAAAQAAYLLGRASGAAEAARWFEAYLREMPHGLLAREAAGRLIESQLAAGNVNAAESAASRYLAQYPNGPHAAMARRALAARSESKD